MFLRQINVYVCMASGDNDLYLAGGDNCNLLYKFLPESADFELMANMLCPRKQLVAV